MNGPVCEASDDNPAQKRSLARFASLLLSCIVLLLTFIGLLRFDALFTRYVRSLNDLQIDHLHDPWLAQLSDLGDQMGSGESLVLVSTVLLAVGYGFRISGWIRAGWQTILAHALSGLAVNALKHSIGRARPKFMHSGHAVFSPFSGNDWDSFPSGHAMAAFAVATVIAVRFPKVRWPVLALASGISISRLFRGSHYLTDIVGGAVLGVVIGTLSAYPWKDWRSSLVSALVAVTAPLAACLALVTTMTQMPAGAWWGTAVRGAGLVITFVGVLLIVLRRAQPRLLPFHLIRPLVLVFVGLGVGMFSGSPFVTLILLLTCAAHWIRSVSENSATAPTHHPWPHETAFGLAVLMMLYTMIELRGTCR
ncbi:MAG TPA: phosphatase PAP2 family protein [Nitrospira sp.]|nr:phosphatase PAP2 family protein [Nitrospira sp.]